MCNIFRSDTRRRVRWRTNAGRESNDSWFGRRRKCSERRRKSGRSECEEEEQERQEGEERGGAAEEVREEQEQRLTDCWVPTQHGSVEHGGC